MFFGNKSNEQDQKAFLFVEENKTQVLFSIFLIFLKIVFLIQGGVKIFRCDIYSVVTDVLDDTGSLTLMHCQLKYQMATNMVKNTIKTYISEGGG